MSAVGPWHEPMFDVAVRKHAVNNSALPQLETMQMKYALCWSNLWDGIQEDMAQATVQVYCLWDYMLYNVDPNIGLHQYKADYRVLTDTSLKARLQ